MPGRRKAQEARDTRKKHIPLVILGQGDYTRDIDPQPFTGCGSVTFYIIYFSCWLLAAICLFILITIGG